ncbi:MAG: hypothetical protein EF813_09720 [Methanosarcinales archaeon]|nr:MAG: hypothetical protein EF813_09720 [Methanosarcinales archaeon]
MKTKYAIYGVMIAIAALSTPISAEYNITGDVNNDGIITTEDSLLALRMAAGSVAPAPERADMDADGRVGSLDALLIQTIVAQQTQVCVNAPEVVSGEFEVTIDVHNVADLDCGQFDLSFNSSVVTVKDVGAGSMGGTEIPIMWRFRSSDVIQVLFNTPGTRGVSGSGCVAKISFDIKGSEGDSCVLDLLNGGLGDNRAEMIPAIWIYDAVTIGEHTPLNRVHNLDTGEDFSFIQAAIDDPDTLDGHIIKVDDGLYRENVNVIKSLMIRSENGSANCVIQGAGGDYVVEMTADHVSITGFTVAGRRASGMVCGMAGIYLNASCCNVSENICLNNRIGICLCNSSNNSISNNDCSNNEQAGIRLEGSGNNRLSGNIMFENGIVIRGDSPVDYMQEIDETNTVNGKPVYYWLDVESGRIPDGAGQVILVNCEGVLVENQKLSDVSIGIEVAFSSNVTVRNNKCSDNRNSGIHLSLSHNNVVSRNDCLNNRDGIRLYESGNNNISSNNCLNNDDDGICLCESSNNKISKNICSNEEGGGIHLYESRNNAVSSNDCSHNRNSGVHLDNSSGNNLSHNICSNNKQAGIFLGCSGNNNISRNICSNDRRAGIRLYESSDNIIYLNNFINRDDNCDSRSSTNIWNSTSKINYTYMGKTFANYLGNYRDDYTENDSDKDGIGDSPYRISSDRDNYPLMLPVEIYFASGEDVAQVCVNAPEVVSGTFDATIDISNVVDLDSGQFDLSFDPGVVNVTAVNDWQISGEHLLRDSWEFIDADTIRVIFGSPKIAGLRGSGQIATISFEVTGSQGATCVLDISNGTLTDTVADEIPAIWNDSNVTVGVPVTVSAPEVASIVSGVFNATIEIEDVTDLNRGQFDLSFDPDVVNVTDVTAGDINGTTIPILNWRFMDAGTIRALFKLSGDDGVGGNGYVARIDFKITGLQGDSCVLDISDGGLADTSEDEIPAIWSDCKVTIGVPVTVNAPEVVSGAFEVTIDIENVTDLDSGQFELWFDSSVVNMTGVSAGNISGTAVPMDMWTFNNDAETILVLFNLPGLAGVSGSGQIATISFETTGIEDYSYLDISNGVLVDNRANKIPAIWTEDMVISGENTLVDRVHNLNTGEDFFFIGDAINDPDTLDEHTIMVGDGVHRENVRVAKSLTILSENGSANCIVKGGRGSAPTVEITADYVDMSGFTVTKGGIHLAADYCNVSDNTCSNNQIGIYLDGSNNIVSGNDCSNNERHSIYLYGSSNNSISGNNCSNNERDGISLYGSSNNSISSNNISNNGRMLDSSIVLGGGIFLSGSDNNVLTKNDVLNNSRGIDLYRSNDSLIYFNNFIYNSLNVQSRESTNTWRSLSKTEYTYSGKTFTNYLGNYWDEYTRTDANNDGIGDFPYYIDSGEDNYPLVMPIENYFVRTANVSEQKYV